MKNTFELVNLTNLTLSEVIDFLTTHFNPRETMHKHLSIPAESFVKSFEPVIKASHQSGYSFAAKTAEGQIASLVLALPYDQLQQSFSTLPQSYFPARSAPIIAMVNQIQHSYKPQTDHQAICCFIVSTNEKFKGNRLLEKILTEIERKGIQDGYFEFFADCTGNISQRVFGKLDYQTQKQIDYRTFQFEGSFPFQNLTEADCVKLMVKKIPRPA